MLNKNSQKREEHGNDGRLPEWNLIRASTIKKTKELRKLLQKLKNESIQEYLKGLTATEITDYSLYKATRRLKRPQVPVPPIKTDEGNWASTNQEKAETFARHLSKVFKPFDSEITQEEEYEI